MPTKDNTTLTSGIIPFLGRLFKLCSGGYTHG
nr:MAG TPA: hypothetical protein [Caudoviricetes sp.]